MNNSNRVQGGEVTAVVGGEKGSRSDSLVHVPFLFTQKEKEELARSEKVERKYDYKSLSLSFFFFVSPLTHILLQHDRDF